MTSAASDRGPPDATHLVEADSDVRLDLLVASTVGCSRTHAATLIATDSVRIDQRREKASYKARKGELVQSPISAGVPDLESDSEPVVSPNGKSKKPRVTGVPAKPAGAEAPGGQ